MTRALLFSPHVPVVLRARDSASLSTMPTRSPDTKSLLAWPWLLCRLYAKRGRIVESFIGWDEGSPGATLAQLPHQVLTGFLPKGVCGQLVLHCVPGLPCLLPCPSIQRREAGIDRCRHQCLQRLPSRRTIVLASHKWFDSLRSI